VELVSIASGQRELSAAVEDDAVLAVKPGLHLLHAIYVYDRGTMNPQELPGIKL
jgi:hypothetical protein